MDAKRVKNIKINKCLIFFTILILTMFFTSTLYAQSFEEFKKQQEKEANQSKDEFKQYKKKLQGEFKAYKRILKEEFYSYRGKIAKKWKKPEVSTKKKWVEYSPDLKSKKVVDFEKGYIKIDIIVPKNKKNNEEQFNKILGELLTENTKTAYDRDVVSQKVEKRMKKISKNIVSSKVKPKPIVTDVVFNKPPSKKAVKKKVKELKKKGTVKTMPSKIKNTKVVSLKIKIPNAFMKKAEKLKPVVHKYASKRKVSERLIMAIVQSESGFNPMAKSYVPAYGLMQVVPRSAGLDASAMVYGKQKMLSSSFLYDSENNINMGTTYVHILFYRYLRKITNFESRLYCSIAAYNTGAGNVAKTFIGNTNINRASKTINKMSPGAVYKKLLRNLPHEETRRYLKNVSTRMKAFEVLYN